jgi:uncharacterized protein (DUF4415 family)
MKSIKKTKPKHGPVDLLPPDAFNKKDTKFRITMFMDLDLLEEVRKRAKNEGLPYQTYINHFLRKTHLGSEEDAKIRRIVREELLKTGS